jgi:hypothetical protein
MGEKVEEKTKNKEKREKIKRKRVLWIFHHFIYGEKLFCQTFL